MNTHITEATWFNAKRHLPDSAREVMVVFKCYRKRHPQNRMAQAKFEVGNYKWNVDSKMFDPSVDVVTQWAELEMDRGGFMPDDFPSPGVYEFISNKM